jgi:streptomycin 6-kinase
LVHGDVHQLNALESDSGFKLVDPDGLLAEAGKKAWAAAHHEVNHGT